MRMPTSQHEWLVNIPLSVALMTSSWWIGAFETGSWFFHTLLPYIGAVVGVGQASLIFLKIVRWFRRGHQPHSHQ